MKLCEMNLIEKPCESTSVLPVLQPDESMSIELVEQTCELITGPDGDNSGDNSDDTYDAYSTNEDAKEKRFQWKISDISHAIRKLNVEEKTEVLRKSLDRETGECLAEIVHSNSESVFEGKLCAGFLDYLTKLQQKKKTRELYAMLDDIFPDLLNADISAVDSQKDGAANVTIC